LEKVVDLNVSPIFETINSTTEAWPQRFIISYSINEAMPFEIYKNGLAELGETNNNNNKKLNEGKLNSASNSNEIKTRGLGR
jgi:hypothetical protein